MTDFLIPLTWLPSHAIVQTLTDAAHLLPYDLYMT